MNKFISAVFFNHKAIPGLVRTFLDNRALYRKNCPARRAPLAVVWDIHHTCNARCIFCKYWEKGTEFKPELSTTQKIEIIEGLGKAGVGFLSFCSGEPLLFQDLDKLIKAAKKQKMLVNISTNGYLLPEKYRMLIDSKVDFVSISVDSHLAKVHNELRGTEGLFERIEDGIDKITKERKNKTPHIEVRCLINKLNAFQLAEYFDYWADKVDGIIFKPIYNNQNNFFHVPFDLQIDKDSEEEFRRYYFGFLKKHRSIDTDYHRQIPDFFFHKDRLKKKYKCFAGFFFGHIDCQGNFYTCREMDESNCLGNLGNLSKKSVLELWNSEKANNARKFLKSPDRCDCWMDKFILNILLQNKLFIR